MNGKKDGPENQWYDDGQKKTVRIWLSGKLIKVEKFKQVDKEKQNK